MKSLSAIIILTFFSAAVFAQAGDLDNTFDADGKITTDINSGDDGAISVAIQPDGKIVTTGYAYNATGGEFALVRYNTDGTLDSNFSEDGKVTTPIGSGAGATSVIIQADGKIVAGGASFNGPDDDFTMVRYNTDGELDSSFSDDGKAITVIGSGNSVAESIAAQPDGKIVAAGFSHNGTIQYFALVRYNTDGSLDSSFSNDGIVTTAIGPGTDGANSLAIQPDGKIIAAGISISGTETYFGLARYNTDGTLDNTFSTDGKVTTDIGSGTDVASSVAIQQDGKIVVAGSSSDGTNYDFSLVRYNADGTLDNGFSSDGKVTTAISAAYDRAFSVALQPDGKIVAAGSSWDGTNYIFALVRYNTDGTLDNSFNADGKVTTDIGSGNDEANSLVIQSDGKIVVAGRSDTGLNIDFAVVRYLSGLNVGTLNLTFSSSSQLIYPNPIHQTETLEYTLTKNESLTIALYDVNGKLIRNFISDEQRSAGAHKETLNIGELTSGNYFLTISNGSQKMTVKIVKQ